MKSLSSTTLRTALVDYRAELMRMAWKYPDQFKNNDKAIKEIDDVLLSIEGNITLVGVTPLACNPNV
jgi:hypothetical protein